MKMNYNISILCKINIYIVKIIYLNIDIKCFEHKTVPRNTTKKIINKIRKIKCYVQIFLMISDCIIHKY